MKPLCYLFVLFFLFSCTDKEQIAREHFLLEQGTAAYYQQYGRLYEKLMDTKECAEDRSEGPDMQNAFSRIYSLQQTIADSMFHIIAGIEEIKKEILQQNGIYVEAEKDPDPGRIIRTEKKHCWKNPGFSLEADYGEKLVSLGKRLKAIRKQALVSICTYHTESRNGKEYRFADPMLTHFDGLKSDSPVLRNAVRECAPDDVEGFTHFYLRLSRGNLLLDEDAAYLKEEQSMLDVLSTLTATQTMIMSATADLASLIRSYIGCGGGPYNFNMIFLNVDGPEAVMQGDSVELRLFYSFYNSFKIPEIEVDGVKPDDLRIECKEGMAYLRFRAKENKQLSGKLTVYNKSGIGKTTPWQKSIRVLKH